MLWQVRRGLITGRGAHTPAAAAATTTFDSSHTGASYLPLSNGNLTASSAAGTTSGSRSIANHSSGKYYCEITVVAETALSCVGIANSSWNFADGGTLLGNDTNSVSYRPSGSVSLNNTSIQSGLDTFNGNGFVISVAFDAGAKLIWFRVGSGSWNNNVLSGSTNPATGVGGIDLSAQGANSIAAGPYYAAVGSAAFSPNTFTANFDIATATQSTTGLVAAGFGNW